MYRGRAEHSLSNVVVLLGATVPDSAKIPEFCGFVAKRVAAVIGFAPKQVTIPNDDAGKPQPFAFLEFADARSAMALVHKHSLALTRAMTVIPVPFAEALAAGRPFPDFVPPPPLRVINDGFAPARYDPTARELIAVRQQSEISLLLVDPSAALLHSISATAPPRCYTEAGRRMVGEMTHFVEWSRRGTFLTTIQDDDHFVSLRTGSALCSASGADVTVLDHPGAVTVEWSQRDTMVATFSLPRDWVVWDTNVGRLRRSFTLPAPPRPANDTPAKRLQSGDAFTLLQWCAGDRYLAIVTKGVPDFTCAAFPPPGAPPAPAPPAPAGGKKGGEGGGGGHCSVVIFDVSGDGCVAVRDMQGVVAFEWSPTLPGVYAVCSSAVGPRPASTVVARLEKGAADVPLMSKEVFGNPAGTLAWQQPSCEVASAGLTLLTTSRRVTGDARRSGVIVASLAGASAAYSSASSSAAAAAGPGVYTAVDVYRTCARGCPVDTIIIPGEVAGVFVEPGGTHIGVVGATRRVWVFDVVGGAAGKGGDVREVLSLCDKDVSVLEWSPAGGHFVLAGLSPRYTAGVLEFWSVKTKQMYAAADHFMMTNIAWDPSGRVVGTYVSHFKNNLENGLRLWTFQGKPLDELKAKRLFMCKWRPRPPPLSTADDRAALVRKLPARIRDVQKRMADQSHADRGRAERERVRLVGELASKRAHLASWLAAARELRKRLRGGRDDDRVWASPEQVAAAMAACGRPLVSEAPPVPAA